MISGVGSVIERWMSIEQTAKNQAGSPQNAKKQPHVGRADAKGAIRLSPNTKLSGTEKRRLAASIQKAKRNGKIPRTAQQTVPYQEMCRDGICVVTDRYFTNQI
ncbi:MAG: hypothetical protein K2K53_07360 [Oscillospiraceae bacterium]|nr:hypothetical protein [Oscillospiraceae bacterium]